jgi:hypothetical protein
LAKSSTNEAAGGHVTTLCKQVKELFAFVGQHTFGSIIVNVEGNLGQVAPFPRRLTWHKTPLAMWSIRYSKAHRTNEPRLIDGIAQQMQQSGNQQTQQLGQELKQVKPQLIKALQQGG